MHRRQQTKERQTLSFSHTDRFNGYFSGKPRLDGSPMILKSPLIPIPSIPNDTGKNNKLLEPTKARHTPETGTIN